jgi:hypothetical protein
VLESLLTGGFSSRLLSLLRVRDGSVYSVNARAELERFDARGSSFSITTSTAPERAAEVVTHTLGALAEFARDGPTPEEMASYRARLSAMREKSYLSRMPSTYARTYAAQVLAKGSIVESREAYFERSLAVSAEQTRLAARRIFGARAPLLVYGAATNMDAALAAALATHTMSGPKRTMPSEHEPIERYDGVWLYDSLADLRAARASLATIGHGVEARASTLGAEAGLGLFVTSPIAAGALITEYDGERIDWKTARERSASHIRSVQKLRTAIDGLRVPETGRGGGSFANDTVLLAQSTTTNIVRSPTNAAFVTLKLKADDTEEAAFSNIAAERIAVALVATRDIAADEEVFVSYGDDYWKKLLNISLVQAHIC